MLTADKSKYMREYMRNYTKLNPQYSQEHNRYSCEYWKTHREQQHVNNKRAYLKLKLEVFSVYSQGEPKCKFCGETNTHLLTLDHINEDGKEHRKTVKGGKQIYLWIKRNNYPTGFQVLCQKCNKHKYRTLKRLSQ